jgi:hypothetical protein
MNNKLEWDTHYVSHPASELEPLRPTTTPGYDAAVLDDDYQPRNAVSSIEVTRASKRLPL